MKHMKTFEGLFDFIKGKSKPNTWQEKFEKVWSVYQKLKSKEKMSLLEKLDRPNININDDNFSVAIGISPHLVFYRKGHRSGDLIVIDFDECDYSDHKSDKGVYKITDSDYNSFLKKAEIINNWLDELSEKETGKSHIDIDSSGEFELDENELALDEVNYKLKEEAFKKFIGKTFEFEVKYHLWSSVSKNERVVDRQNFKIKDITVDFGGGRFWAQIWTMDMFDKESYIWVESDSNYNYVDLEKLKPWEMSDKSLKMDIQKKEMTRKQQRDSDKNQKYPFVISYDVCPSKYDTIEFVKSIVELLGMMNHHIDQNEE